MKRNLTAPAALTFIAAVLLAGCTAHDTNLAKVVPSPQGQWENLYVVEQARDQVAVLDAISGKLLGAIPVGKSPCAILNDDLNDAHSVWVANSASNSVTLIDANSNQITATVPVGSIPVSISASRFPHKVVTVANKGDDTVTYLDPYQAVTVATVHVGRTPVSVSSARNQEQVTAVANAGDNSVSIVDDASHRVKQTLSMPAPPAAVMYDDASLNGSASFFVLVPSNDRIYVISPDAAGTYSIAKSFPAGNGAETLSKDGIGYTTVTSVADHTASVIANDSLHITYPLGSHPGASDGGSHFNTVYRFFPDEADDTITAFDVSASSTKPAFSFKLPSGVKAVALAYARGANTVAPVQSPTPAATPTPVATATPVASSAHLYVANGNANTVLAYGMPVNAGSAPSSTISYTQIASGVASDGHGTTAIVADSKLFLYSGAITAASQPIATVYLGVNGFPAFDSKGNVYVTSFWTQVFEIDKPFGNASQPSIHYVADHGVGIAFDSSDNMYVANTSSGNIDVVAPPYTNNSQVVVQPPLSGAALSGAAVHNGQLFVTDPTDQRVFVYGLPLNASGAPASTFGAAHPHGIAFDAAGSLYVANAVDNRIDVYSAPFTSANPAPAFSLTNVAFNEPIGVGFGP